MSSPPNPPDPFSARERPADSLIVVEDSPERTRIYIPPRPLTIPLKILLTLNIASVIFWLAVGILYLAFHISVFTGLPDPVREFSRHGPQLRWFSEVFVGWLLALFALVGIHSYVWIPQISTESVILDHTGLHWRRDGWWRHEKLDAAWKDLNEVVAVGNMPEIAPNRLLIQLFDGHSQPIAENTSNAERNWLEFIVDRASSKYRGI